MGQWNLRYLAYCYANQKLPEEMNEIDRERYPGGRMAGFMCWNMQHWADFSKIRTMDRYLKTKEDHTAYDAWLAAKYMPTQRNLFAA